MSNKNLERLRKSIWIILIIIIFFVPLIVTLKIMPVPESLQWLYNKEQHVDIFSAAKVQLLQVGAIICVVLACVYHFYTYQREGLKKNKISVILFGGLILSIWIAFLMSDQKQLAWSGMIDRYEGTLTWLCYIGLTYSVVVSVKNKSEMRMLIYAFVISSTVVSVIGMFQWMGIDFFKTEMGLRVMLGTRFEELRSSVNFNLPEGRVYTTLYNPNYVGSLIAIAFPLTIYSVVMVKRWLIKPLFGLMIIPQMITLYGSQSTGGLIAVVTTIAFMGIYLLIKFPLHKGIYFGVIALLIMGYLIFTQLAIFQPYYAKILRSLDAEPDTYFTTEFASVDYEHPMLRYNLNNGEYIEISPIEGGLDVVTEGEGELIQDKANQLLIYRITSENYFKQVIYNYSEELVRVWVQNLQTEKISESRFNYYYNGHFSVGTLPLDEYNFNAESTKWFKNERLMSNRGYIWNRTIQLVFEKPVFGYGADTYTAIYPQGDLIYKHQIFGNHVIVVDKPHNLFLTIALNFGFVGLIFFLCISLQTFIQSRFDFLMIPILSYFVVGLVNDSVVFATYIIFVLFGLLLILPNMMEEESK
jgi:hypothetical protein